MLMAHGANKVKGGRDNAGRWFSSMGMRHGGVQARLAALTELGCGALLVLGLLTPFAAAGVIGVMAVAGWVAHRKNGYLIINEGWEFVLSIALAPQSRSGCIARCCASIPTCARPHAA
jgi:putative oxidoreductase